MSKVIKIEDQDIINLLQRLQYEVESRKEIIGFIISTDGINSESFKKYEKDYQDFYIQYQEAKAQFEELYVKPAVPDASFINWKLNFERAEVTIS